MAKKNAAMAKKRMKQALEAWRWVLDVARGSAGALDDYELDPGEQMSVHAFAARLVVEEHLSHITGAAGSKLAQPDAGGHSGIEPSRGILAKAIQIKIVKPKIGDSRNLVFKLATPLVQRPGIHIATHGKDGVRPFSISKMEGKSDARSSLISEMEDPGDPGSSSRFKVEAKGDVRPFPKGK